MRSFQIILLAWFMLPIYHLTGQEIFRPFKVVDYDQLKPYLSRENDTTYVINFWATWCVPCVGELPYFQDLEKQMEGKPFRLLLVSLDFKKDYDTRLKSFVEKHNLISNVLVLEDIRADVWINDIDPSWSGAIPATLVYKGEKRLFYERTFHSTEELLSIVKPLIN